MVFTPTLDLRHLAWALDHLWLVRQLHKARFDAPGGGLLPHLLERVDDSFPSWIPDPEVADEAEISTWRRQCENHGTDPNEAREVLMTLLHRQAQTEGCLNA